MIIIKITPKVMAIISTGPKIYSVTSTVIAL